MDAASTGGSTIDQLGTLFNVLGSQALNWYKALNPPTVVTPPTTLPQSSSTTVGNLFGNINLGEVLILGLVIVGTIFGIKALSRR